MVRVPVALLGLAVSAAVLSAVPAGSTRQQPAPPQQTQPAGQQQQQPPVFRAGVKLVRVDVTVNGRGDEPVSDLQADDFEVAEDGLPQRVEQLQYVKLDGQTPPGDDRSLEIRSQEQAEAEAARDDVRVFAIFFDDYHIDRLPSITIPLRRALTTFVDRMWATDLVALMDPLTPLSALRFTRSRAELHDAISKFEGRQGEVFPIKSVIEEAQLTRADIVRVRAEVTLSALAALVVRLGGLREGRKTIVFVSQGPPVFLGRDGNLQDRMREIREAASRGNVTIYTVDPRSLGMVARGSRETLYQLADETGGRTITNTNDASQGLGRVLADTSAYYVLGYQPTRAQDDGRYHRISVKVKRPGVHVLARQGYWAPSGKEIETARAAAAAPAPVARLAAVRRPAEVWVGVSRGQGERSQVMVAWERPDQVTSRAPAADTLEVDLQDAQGQPVDAGRSLPAGSTGGAATTFQLAPGLVSLRFTAKSLEGGVLDAWAQPLLVPEYAGPALALSSLRLYRARSLAEFKAIQAAPDAALPAATRRFRAGDRIVVVADCYWPAGAADPAVEATLLAKDGKELAPLPMPPLAAGRAKFELPLGSLGQGTYILRVRARLGSDTHEQFTAFAVTR